MSLVVIALDARTARWCASPIWIDDHESVLRPRVIGPALVPIVDETTACEHPELAVLSLLAHRREPIALDLSRAILTACGQLDEARAELYADVAFGFLDDAQRRALEAEMKLENYVPQSEFLRGLKAAAIASGHAEGVVSSIFAVLAARGLAVTEAQRERVAACTDLDQLGQWLHTAATASSTDELFAG